MRVGAILPLLLSCTILSAHDGHSDRTYELAASAEPADGERFVELEIRAGDSRDHLPARFSIELDGKPWVPDALSDGGIRFTSIHARKKQRVTVLYSRGNGAVRFAIPSEAKSITVHAMRGLQYRPARTEAELKGDSTSIEMALERFVDLESENWRTADTHLHYERRDPKHDADWLAMLGADGLNHGFFMVLQGGNFNDVWAQQFAYGKAGEGSNERQLLVTGEEFRGPLQGHNNLFGLSEVLTPISVGGMGTPPHAFNSPSTHDVLRRTRELGGIGGPAHGGTFGKASTAIVDALNGASEFFELANTHLLEIEPWYRVMNCGRLLPPVAGTDLPNYPFRDPWQPFFGEVRTFVRCEKPSEFEVWKEALRAGRVFISSGPLLTKFTVNGATLGESVDLPANGGTVEIDAEVISPRPIGFVEILRNGNALSLPFEKSVDGGIHRARVQATIPLEKSNWLAVTAMGPRKEALFTEGKILQRTMMFSAAIPVSVGGAPIREEADVQAVVEQMRTAREVYRTQGKFPDDTSRDAMLKLFDAAITSVAE